MSEVDIFITDEDGTPVEPGTSRWQEVFDDLVAKGIIVPDADAAGCPGCGEPLDSLSVAVLLTTVDPPREIERRTLQWAKGLHQFLASPGFFGFVREGWGEFRANCVRCSSDAIELEIVDEPHGLKFSEVTRMAGRL